MKSNQCLYDAFCCNDLRAYLKVNDISNSVFVKMFDFYCDFLKHKILDTYLDTFTRYCPDRSIKDICNHINNICHEYYDSVIEKN